MAKVINLIVKQQMKYLKVLYYIVYSQRVDIEIITNSSKSKYTLKKLKEKV